MTEAETELIPKIDQAGERLPVTVDKLYQDSYDHYYGEEAGPGREEGGEQRRAADARRRAVEQVLFPAGLDDLGIPRVEKGEPLPKAMVISCKQVIAHLEEEAPEALASWVDKRNDEARQYFDSDDVRIGVIHKLAKERLKQIEKQRHMK